MLAATRISSAPGEEGEAAQPTDAHSASDIARRTQRIALRLEALEDGPECASVAAGDLLREDAGAVRVQPSEREPFANRPVGEFVGLPVRDPVMEGDSAQMIERCIDAPESVRFDIFYVVSNNRWRHRDIEHARLMVGYEPQDNAEGYRGG